MYSDCCILCQKSKFLLKMPLMMNSEWPCSITFKPVLQLYKWPHIQTIVIDLTGNRYNPDKFGMIKMAHISFCVLWMLEMMINAEVPV